MRTGRRARSLSVLLVFALLAATGACRSGDDDEAETGGGGAAEGEEASIPTEDCATDPTQEIEGDTIKLVSSYPQSGLTAAFSEIARGWRAYFEMINEEEGGVTVAGNQYQIEFDDRDDQYDPATTASNIQELVGTNGEDAFAAFSVVGTANNLAIRDNLNDLCVPDLFAATGSPAWGNENYPWLMGSTLVPYPLEPQSFVRLLEDEDPDASIAVLVQDDDFGRAYEESLENAIEGTDHEIVQVERYAPGSSEVAAQMTSLAATNADAFFNGATLLACPDALTRVQEAGWEPITWVSGTCVSKTLMGLAGEAANGVYSLTNIKDPLNPDWDDDEAMQLYREKVEQYEGGNNLDLDNGIVAFGWTQAAVFVEVLEQAEAPTRLAVMEALRNMDGISDVGLLLPGVTLDTSPPDLYMGEEVQVAQYEWTGPDDRNHFVYVGDLVDLEGQTVEVTPEDLING